MNELKSKLENALFEDHEGNIEHVDFQKHQLVALLDEAYAIGVRDSIKALVFHKEGEELSYCDTGSDMDLQCRSECVHMAEERVSALLVKEGGE